MQIPFLQVLDPGFRFVPIALGTLDFAAVASVGQALGKILSAENDVLLVTTSDFNHYEDQSTTLRKDQLAIDKILEGDGKGLFDV